jgi:hypothetical protein
MRPFRIAVVLFAAATAGAAAHAQNAPPAPGVTMPMHHPMMMEQPATVPTQAGQAAFGAIQETVHILLADPKTDWSKVNIDALRQHLIDMNELTMRAQAKEVQIPGGARILVTGTGRTLPGIQRMIPAHAVDINGLYGWSAKAKSITGGEEMTVTAADPEDVQKIRALGFMGIMVLGTHQMHHLGMAKGESMNMHGMH